MSNFSSLHRVLQTKSCCYVFVVVVVVMVLVVVEVFVERSLEVLAGGETLPFLTGIDHRHLLLLILLPPLPLSVGWEGH